MQSGFDALARLSVGSTAVFLDFDGTLADLVDQPENVSVDAARLEGIARVRDTLRGAVAIISGREIAAIDRFLAPHVFSASGVHGFEIRIGDGRIHWLAVNSKALARVKQGLADFAQQHEGLLLEIKRASIALHWRQRPDLEAQCQIVAQATAAKTRGLRLMQGKMVVEIKAHDGDKGRAITTFMAGEPFRGRTPVFIGDDVTDEAAFTVVNAMAGHSIKVGDGDTSARYRLSDPAAVHEWLGRLAAGTGPDHPTEGDAR